MQITANLELRSEFSSNRRYAMRRTLTLGSLLQQSGSPAVIRDLSVTGLALETADELSIGERLLVSLPQCGPTAARVVWQDAHLYGCEFEEPVSAPAISAAVLLNPPAARRADTNTIQPEPQARWSEDAPLAPWPIAYRFLLIIGLSAALWALILSAVL